MDFLSIHDLEDNNRVFDPRAPEYRNLSTAEMLTFNESKASWRQLQFTTAAKPGVRVTAEESMVIAIDGACRANGTPRAKAAYGLYFGPGSSMNTQACLPSTASQTSQAAEIQAAIEALDLAQGVTDDNPSIMNIVLMTDSSYLVKSMTEYVWKWVDNGWTNARSQEVVNRRAFEDLHSTIETMEGDGVDVQFWLVPREENRDADRLANLALDSVGNPAARPGWSAPTATPKVKVSSAWDHWNYTAASHPEAQALARRVKLEFPDREDFNLHRPLTYPLRRLVTTGEDTPENFRLLLGPNWEAAIKDDWKKYRIWLLKHHAAVASTDGDSWLSWADYQAPFVRPRPASEEERAQL